MIRERLACPACTGQPGSTALDVAPRRFYSVDAFVFDKCAQQRDGDITGTDCPGGFTVFGPYIEAPANSDVNFVFEVRPSIDATIVADIVSDVGRVVHAATPPLLVRAHERRSTGIRVHLFSHASKLEARVSVNADQPVTYTIHGLSLDVQ